MGSFATNFEVLSAIFAMLFKRPLRSCCEFRNFSIPSIFWKLTTFLPILRRTSFRQISEIGLTCHDAERTSAGRLRRVRRKGLLDGTLSSNLILLEASRTRALCSSLRSLSSPSAFRIFTSCSAKMRFCFLDAKQERVAVDPLHFFDRSAVQNHAIPANPCNPWPMHGRRPWRAFPDLFKYLSPFMCDASRQSKRDSVESASSCSVVAGFTHFIRNDPDNPNGLGGRGRLVRYAGLGLGLRSPDGYRGRSGPRTERTLSEDPGTEPRSGFTLS